MDNFTDIADILIGDDTALEFSVNDFNMDYKPKQRIKSRYITPKLYRPPDKPAYKNAKKIISEFSLQKNEQKTYIVNGSFIYGDFIESLFVEKNLRAEHVNISTLSLSQENIDSLEALLKQDYINSLTLVISNYYYSHERRNMIPYLLERLDYDNKLDLIVTRNHTKIMTAKIGGFYLVITGSANLRSSNSLEEFTISESEQVYNFYSELFKQLHEYSIINREVVNER